MATAHFNIGSNLGDRLAAIGRAVALLEHAIGAGATVSAPVLSDAWGFDSPNRFINVGVNIDAGNLSARRLLEIAAETERLIDPDGRHRTPDGGYADRMIDIDLLCVGAPVSQADPVLPHPRMQDREFVLRPLAGLLPDWRHPLSGMTATELLEILHTK
ncbi:MAG: 2-amino-4-hydroxy-6-hydroxymethyldihydropteridine diphosphokinase [Muribaculaceae bacterium]|nr:2-amino-4-hydroxy-6-hydroxymethyldihydropteridine diphosphokinase [Muribaculaceae bacterium]